MNMGELEYDAKLTERFYEIMRMGCIDCKDRELYLMLIGDPNLRIGMPDAPDNTQFCDNTGFFKRSPPFARGADLSPDDKKALDRWSGWKNDKVYRVKAKA